MRSKSLLTGILVFAIVAAGGLGVSWYFQASEARKSVEQFVAAINAKQPYLTYESIQTSGFPTEVRVSIVKPRFSGRIDEMLKAIDESAKAGQAPPISGEMSEMVSKMTPWQEDFALDGAITFTVNALSDSYGMIASGNWTSTGTIGGQTFSMASQSTGDSACYLKLERSRGLFSQLWDFGSLNRDSKALGEDFRHLDCSFAAYTATDPASGATLISSGGGRLYASRQPHGQEEEIRFFFKSIDTQVHPEGDKAIVARLKPFMPDYPFFESWAAYGKQNVEIDFSYRGLGDFTAEGAKDHPLDINLGKFSLSNDLYSVNALLRLTSSKTGAERNARWILKSDTVMSQQYVAFLKNMLRSFIAELYTSTDPAYASFKQALQKYTPEQVYDMVLPLLPDYAAMGKMTFNNDLSYVGADDFSTANVTLSDLELSTAQYGITAKGTAAKAAGQMLPVTNLVIECTNCPQLLTDMFNYAMRLQTVVATFQPDKPPVKVVTPEMAAGVQAFLRELSEPIGDKATQTHFRYTLISDGASNITVSGRPVDQVMALYAQHLDPVLPQTAPGAGGTPKPRK